MAATVGDEAILLAEMAPTWVARYRPLGAQYAIDSGSTVIVMDDGFQNPLIYKDFSLIVVDGTSGFGNGSIIPAGPLRERVEAGLARAHAVVIVGEDRCGVRETVVRHVPDMPILTASLRPSSGNPDVAGKTVFAFAGIGRPKKFKETLIAAGALLEGWGEYPDHFDYLEEDLTEMMAAAYAKNAMVVTTAKDYVRLPKGLKDRVEVFRVELVWDEPQRLQDLILAAFAKRAW